ncbi:DUF397 domain-containing protein [Streptosporangium amethystogenes]|uniref:DUF397 domain-containing protein n=1 Tax=Streptosporangium amethystogenes TaxID=2002 RepID=UPI0037AD32D4
MKRAAPEGERHHVRDSKDSEGPVLVFVSGEQVAFVAAIKGGFAVDLAGWQPICRNGCGDR